MITRATNRNRRDRNCSSTYWGVPGTAGGTGGRREAVRMLQLHTLPTRVRREEGGCENAAAAHTAHWSQKSRASTFISLQQNPAH